MYYDPIQFENVMVLEKLVGRQRRPVTGDLFRVKIVGGDYYFGMVVDHDMEVSPIGRGGILALVFSGGSVTGLMGDFGMLIERPLLIPAKISNQRLWTMGYAEKIGTTSCAPPSGLVFRDLKYEEVYFDRFGREVPRPVEGFIGVWGLGNEYAMSGMIADALMLCCYCGGPKVPEDAVEDPCATCRAKMRQLTQHKRWGGGTVASGGL